MEWNVAAGEVNDPLFRDASAKIVDANKMLDFIHGHAVGIDCAGFEDVGHVGLGGDEPFQGLHEVGFGENEPGGFVDGRDHGELVDAHLSSADVVDQPGMVWDWRFT